MCMMAQQQPGNMPYSSQFSKKLELYKGDLISHQSGGIRYASIFICLFSILNLIHTQIVPFFG